MVFSTLLLPTVTVFSAEGNLVMDNVLGSSINVTFAVTSGPGFVLGCGNGDPANQQPAHAVCSCGGL